MIDLLEGDTLYPAIDFCVDTRAVYDDIFASDASEFAEGSIKFHLISVRDRMAHGLIRTIFLVDTRDMLAVG